MILVVTNRDDFTADWLILELVKRGTPFLRFNTEDYPNQVEFQWSPHGPGTLKLSDVRYDLSEFKAVWYRRPVPPVIAAYEDTHVQVWAEEQAREGLVSLWRTMPAIWVNHPDKNRAASSKAEQLSRASRLGFQIPATLITNDSAATRKFAAALPGGVVCKAVKEGRFDAGGRRHAFFTTLLTEELVSATKELGPEPYIFQEFVEKQHDVRVTIVGEEAFAARILSQGNPATVVDWRTNPTTEPPHEIETLPSSVAKKCVALARSYGIAFAAIDLVFSTDGNYFFLEINPNGQWAWVEQATGLPLRSKLADLLEDGWHG